MNEADIAASVERLMARVDYYLHCELDEEYDHDRPDSARKRLEAAGLVISGTSPDDRLVEIVEIHDHPFFVASQYHPEFKSRPERPAPLFREFVAAALGRARERRPQEITAHQAAHST